MKLSVYCIPIGAQSLLHDLLFLVLPRWAWQAAPGAAQKVDGMGRLG